MYKGFKGNWADQMYFNGKFKFSKEIDIALVDKTRLIDGKFSNKLTDAYISYTKTFKTNKKIPVFNQGFNLNVRIGMFEWFPTYTNVQLILENADKFINPAAVYGGSIIIKIPAFKDKSLNIQFSAITGDVIFNKIKPQLLDLYANYTKIFKYNIGISVQAGIAEGSMQLLNFAELLYQPKLEKIELDIRAGKLPTYDDSPYGIHIGFTRKFKYIMLGGYYEKRYKQNTRGQIAGFQWGIVGPPKLVKVFSTFNIFYDFNTTTLWMWIPVIKIQFQHK